MTDYFLLPPDLWLHICDLLDEPVDTTRDRGEMLAAVAREHPIGHNCPRCVAREQAMSS